jgi:hypothetical protein
MHGSIHEGAELQYAQGVQLSWSIEQVWVPMAWKYVPTLAYTFIKVKSQVMQP